MANQHWLLHAPHNLSGAYKSFDYLLQDFKMTTTPHSLLPTLSPTQTARSSLVFQNITYFPLLKKRLLKLLSFGGFLVCTLGTQTKISHLNDCLQTCSFFFLVCH